MYLTQPYNNAVENAAELAPDLINSPSKVFEWAEIVVNTLAFIYGVDHDKVTEDLINKAKELQDYED